MTRVRLELPCRDECDLYYHLQGSSSDGLLRVNIECRHCGAVGPIRNDKDAAMQAFVEALQTRH